MTNSKQTSLQSEAGGAPLVRRVWRAVNAAERSICGDAAVDSASVAEGLAVARCRASRLIEPERDEMPSGATLDVPWVDHRIRRGQATQAGGYAFELVAADGQQAVDHCLVAHRLAARLGRPGLCTLDYDLAEKPEPVRLPEASWIQDLPAVESAPREDPLREQTIDHALAAFAEVARQTGRALAPVSGFGLEGARCVLLTTGSGGPLALRSAEALRLSGIACGAVALGLTRPFPTALLRERLAGVEAVAILPPAGDPGDWLARRAEVAAEAGVRVAVVQARPDDPTQFRNELVSALGLEATDPLPPANDLREPVVLGGLPPSERLEDLLLDVVARLAPFGSPMLDLAERDGLLRLTVGGPPDDARPLDLLVAPVIAALAGVGPLHRLRECGSLLVQASTDDPGLVWSALSAEQRAEMIRRRQRLCLFVPEGDDGAGLSGAILAAVPELARTVGDGTPGESGEEAPAQLLAEIRDGARSLVTADPARLGEPETPAAAADRALLRMPPAEEDAGDQRWHERLHRFHFAGIRENDQERSCWPDPLAPAILGASELSASVEATVPTASLFEHWTRIVLGDRRRRQAKLLAEAEALEERLRRIVGRPSGRTGDDLQSRLGLIGAEFVDSEALYDRLSRPRDPVNLPDDRRQRIEQALATLERHRKESGGRPIAQVVCPDGHDAPDLPQDVSVLRHPDALRAAVGLFDGLTCGMVELARALRVARLEVGGNYDETIHGPTLERLDWQSLTADELFCVPAVVVLETARHLRGPALAAFSELIRAGRPLHVLIEERVGDLGAERLESVSGYHPGLGYLAVAHREALVVQSSVGRPEQLAAGIARGAASLDPVVILAAVLSKAGAGTERLQLEAATQARATPCFVYDPAGGTTWAERFTLDGNPQPDRTWPVYSLTCCDEAGSETDLDQAFTFAHAAALNPDWRRHFLLIGPDAWDGDQVEIAAYLELTDRERSRAVPYLWVVEQGSLTRAVIRWELAFACRDRARAWRILQELAGTDNAYALRAADEARRAALEQAEQKIEQLEAGFAIALESSRGDGAATAVERLVGLLADPQGFEAAVASAAVAPGLSVPAATGIPASLPGAVQPELPEPPASAPRAAVAAPYIDSFLCTSCNDCIDLNPRMFAYNENKQAEVTDAAAGTFKELVKAAEACPARCIHPGAARDGDKTATPALIKRAAKFQ